MNYERNGNATAVADCVQGNGIAYDRFNNNETDSVVSNICDGVRDDGSPDILHPGRVIRPMISCSAAVELVQTLYGLPVARVHELNSYYDRNFFVEIKPEGNRNPFIDEVWPHGYVLKVVNSVVSFNQHIDAEHEMQKILASKGIKCPLPVLNLKGCDRSLEDIIYDLPGDPGEKPQPGTVATGRGFHLVRLLTYVPGKILSEAPYTERLLYRIGRFVRILQKAFEGFSHPALDDHGILWELSSVPRVLSFTSAIKDRVKRSLVEEVVDAFVNEVLPNKGHFQKGVIHGDCTQQNILVSVMKTPGEQKTSSSISNGSCSSSNHNGAHHGDHQEEFDICGILDFAEAVQSCYLFDLAIAITYTMLDSKVVDPLDVGGYILAGYGSVNGRGLNEVEFQALRVCIAARYAQTLTMGTYNYSLNPTNEHLLTSTRSGWEQLKRLWEMPASQLYGRWLSIMAEVKRRFL